MTILNVRRMKIIAALLLAFVTAAAGVAVPAEAVVVASPFAGGDGSGDYPYLIETAEQLDSVRDYPDDFFELAANIDLYGHSNWQPIDDFAGSFNGRGFSIFGLFVTYPGIPSGLFSHIESTGTVFDFTMVNSHVSSDQSLSGVIAGLNEGSIYNVVVFNSIVAGAADYAGGVVGKNYGTISEALVFQSDISGAFAVGGIAGQNTPVAGTPDTGIIQRSRVDESAITGAMHTGGAVGINTEGGELVRLSIRSSINQSSGVFGGLEATGGIVGTNAGEVRLSYVNGSIRGDTVVGGLAGVNSGRIEDVSVQGAVYGNSFVGGLIGSQTEGDVFRSLSSNSVVSQGVSGALLGTGSEELYGESNSFNMVYWNTDLLSGILPVGKFTASMGGTYGKDAQQLANQQLYENWDFQSVWYMNQVNGLPELIKPLAGLYASLGNDDLPLYFFPERMSYTVYVPHDTESVHITAEQGRAGDTVFIGQSQGTNANVPLVEGTAHISVTVHTSSIVEYTIDVISLEAGTVDEVNKHMLENAIVEAALLLQFASEEQTIPAHLINALSAAIDAAVLVYESPTADQQAVDDATSALNTATMNVYNSTVDGASIVWAEEVALYGGQSSLAVYFDQELSGIGDEYKFKVTSPDVFVQYAYVDSQDRSKVNIALYGQLPHGQPVTVIAEPGAVNLADETPNLKISQFNVMLIAQANALRQQILAGDTSTGGSIQIHHVVQFVDAHPTGVQELYMPRQRLIRFALDSIPNKYGLSY